MRHANPRADCYLERAGLCASYNPKHPGLRAGCNPRRADPRAKYDPGRVDPRAHYKMRGVVQPTNNLKGAGQLVIRKPSVAGSEEHCKLINASQCGDYMPKNVVHLADCKLKYAHHKSKCAGSPAD